MAKYWISLLMAMVALCTTVVASAERPADGTKNPSSIVMYATKTCGYCAQARAYFKEHGVRFEERDIETSAEARSEWKAFGGVATPLIRINGHSLIGFSRQELDGELAQTLK